MVEKLYEKINNIQEVNETAAKLRQIGLKAELKKLAVKYKVPEPDINEYLSGKRHFLIDGGDTRKDYKTARSKLLDEMFELKDPQFTDVIGNYLIKCCDKSEFAGLVLQKHKTLQRCIESIMDRTYAMVSDEVKQNGRYASMAVFGDTVFGWVREYYTADDREKEAERRKEAEESFQKRFMAQVNAPKGGKGKTNKKRSASKKNKTGGENSTAPGEEGKKSSAKTEPDGQNKGQIEGQVSLFESGLADEGEYDYADCI